MAGEMMGTPDLSDFRLMGSRWLTSREPKVPLWGWQENRISKYGNCRGEKILRFFTAGNGGTVGCM
jgi:hypothetical protein